MITPLSIVSCTNVLFVISKHFHNLRMQWLCPVYAIRTPSSWRLDVNYYHFLLPKRNTSQVDSIYGEGAILSSIINPFLWHIECTHHLKTSYTLLLDSFPFSVFYSLSLLMSTSPNEHLQGLDHSSEGFLRFWPLYCVKTTPSQQSIGIIRLGGGDTRLCWSTNMAERHWKAWCF